MNKQLGKSKLAAFGLAIAVSGAMFAPMAQAGTVELAHAGSGAFGSPDWSRNVTYTLNGETSTRTNPAGLFRLTDTASVGSSILAFCLDLVEFLGSPVTYDTEASSSIPGWAAAAVNIDRLYTSAYSLVTDADTAAGFQIALWEIITDSGSGSALSLGDGNFQTTGNATHYQNAQTYLDGLGTATTGGYNLTTYYSDGNQDLISATPVPVPAAGLLLLGGLFGMGAFRSRRRKA